VQGLTRRLRARALVDDVSLHVGSGEIVGLLGPNGAGKTTSFGMIIGLLPCDAGCIMLGERDLTRMPPDRRARLGIGYLPQGASVFRELSVEDNILALLELRAELDATARRARLEELLHEFHLEHLRRQHGAVLSGGERRRTEFARALAMHPRFLLLDEPFAGVDPIAVQELQQLIRRLGAEGLGVLITDHNVREMLHLCHRSYILSEGRVIASGEREQILANPQVRSSYLGDAFRE